MLYLDRQMKLYAWIRKKYSYFSRMFTYLDYFVFLACRLLTISTEGKHKCYCSLKSCFHYYSTALYVSHRLSERQWLKNAITVNLPHSIVTFIVRGKPTYEHCLQILGLDWRISKMQCRGECYCKCEVQTCKSLTPNAEDRMDQHYCRATADF